MSGKKGMKKYPLGIRETVVSRIHSGERQRALNKKYGISRYAIQSWLKEPDLPKKRGRKPVKTLAEYKNLWKGGEAESKIRSYPSLPRRISNLSNVKVFRRIPKRILRFH